MNGNNETKDEIEFLMKNMNDYLPYLVLHSFGSIFGIIGSIAIFSSIIVTKELQKSTNIIIGNIALADFILSSIIDTLTIAGI